MLKGNLCRCTGYHAIENAIRGIKSIEEPQPGAAFGSSIAAPASAAIVTGKARYTLDMHIDGLLHLKLLRSPHAHARILSIRKDRALAVPGVQAVFTWEDVPRLLFTSANHDDYHSDPNDMYILDNVVRHVGQRVAAVVADSVGAAEEGCRRLEVDYQLLPAVFDAEEAMSVGAPVLHDKGAESRIQRPGRNILLELHGGVGDVEAAFAQADVIHEATYSPHRAQHAHLETHCTISWIDENQRLNVRTSSQTPFLTKAKLCYLFSLYPDSVRVFCERVGGGFGAKQEMVTEDICALATIKTGRPVQLEYTREEQFFGATTRHPMKIHVKAGAKRDGTLTALQLRIVSNTGAYGTHGGSVLFHSTGESVAVYHCPNKKIDAYAVYTNTVPAGAFRGYGLSQTIFAVESAMDELARSLNMDPIEFRHLNVIRPGDPMTSLASEPHDLDYGSYGLDQCLDLVRDALARGNGTCLPRRRRVAGGEGCRAGNDCLHAAHRASFRGASRLEADGRYHLAIGSPEFGNGSTTVRQQIVATVLGTSPACVISIQSDTDRTGYDTGPFGSTGTTVAGKAVHQAAESLRERILDFAARHCGASRDKCRLEPDAVVCDGTRIRLVDLHNAARQAQQLSAGRAQGLWNAAHRGLQRARFSDRGPSCYGRNQDPPERSRSRCRGRDQSAAAPGASRRRYCPGIGVGPVREDSLRPGRTSRKPDVQTLPHPGLCRHPTQRGLFCPDNGCVRPLGRQEHERSTDQPGSPGAGQRSGRCHRHPLSERQVPRPVERFVLPFPSTWRASRMFLSPAVRSTTCCSPRSSLARLNVSSET